jgi:hypothetical protein
VEIEIEAKECAGKLGKLSFLPCHQNASYKYARGEHIDLHYSHPYSPLSSEQLQNNAPAATNAQFKS